MYIAKLLSKQNLANELQVVIEYTNGTETFQETMTTNGSFRDMEQLKEIVKEKIERLNSKEAINSALTVGAEIEQPTVPVEVVKTKDEIAFELFISNYEKLKKVNTLIALGVLVGDEIPVVKLLNTVKSSFKPTYIDLI